MTLRSLSSLARWAVATTLAGLAVPASAAPVDLVTISVDLSLPADGSFFRLAGQSSFFSTRSGSFSTGGQLDGVTSFDSESGAFELSYVEVFPQAALTDYLQFGYFGVVETVVTSRGGESVLDRSLIVAGPTGMFDGATIGALLPFASESELVDALVGGMDTQAFFDALFSAVDNEDLRGDMALFSQDMPGGSIEAVRGGQTLSLYAFTGGMNGDEATPIGALGSSVLRTVPAPGVLVVCVAGGLGGMGVRGRRRGCVGDGPRTARGSGH